MGGQVVSFTADGACDQNGAYSAVVLRRSEESVIVPPRSIAVPQHFVNQGRV